MSVTVLIDANNLGYIEHYANKLRSGDLETQAIFGFMRRMRELRQQYLGAKLICLWDGRAQWRFDLCPSYKSNRDDDPKKIAIKKAYVAQRPYIAKALEHLGISQLTVGNAEADDMAGYLSRTISAKPNHLVVLLSGDHDWLQLVKPGVVWRDPKDMTKLVKSDNFLDSTGYKTPLAFLEGKALQGDTSDVIPGIEGLGKKTAVEFLAQWGSVVNFFKAVDTKEHTSKERKSKDAKKPHPEQILASYEGRVMFVRNMKLMQLINAPKPDPSEVNHNPGKLDRQAFEDLCSELAFFSITKDMDNFFSNFER